MRAVALLVRAGFRRRRGARLGLAVLLATGVGTSLAALSAAWKTDHAYPDYRSRAEVGHVVINPSLFTDHLIDVIRSTPGVEAMVSDALLVAAPGDYGPVSRAELEGATGAFVVGSPDGRYIERDRPAVEQGRMVRSGDEAFFSLDAARALDVDVGDVVPFTFWSAAPQGEDPEEMVAPTGHSVLKVVGIGTFADSVLPDDLYPHERILVSPDVAATYLCVPVQPAPDDPRTLEELLPTFFPSNCSSDARFFSLTVAGGDAGVNDVLARLKDELSVESSRLPAAMREVDATFSVLPTVTAEESNRIRRSLEPGITALRLLGVIVLAATLILAAISAHRAARDRENDSQYWRQLGTTHVQRMVAVAAPIWTTVAVGLVGSVLTGWLTSGIGPVASVRVVAPKHHLGVPIDVLAAVVTLVAAALGASIAVSSWRATRRSMGRTQRQRAMNLAEKATSGSNVSLALGVRAAVRGRGGGDAATLLAVTVTAVVVVVAAVVYSTNLAGLIARPSHFGWPYDAGVVVNYGFPGTDHSAVMASLDRPEVKAWGIAAVDGTATVGNQSMPLIADVGGFLDVGLSTVKGSLPRADDEVAVGAASARLARIAVGDRITVTIDGVPRQATVTGLVVLPAVGAVLADRAGLGTGMLLPEPLYKSVIAARESAFGLEPGTIWNDIGSFVAIDLRDGTDPTAFMASLADGLARWNVDGIQPASFDGPIRPSQISDVAAMRSVPVLIVVLISAAMAVALIASLDRATRGRRRELAILRALGCTAKQLRSTLRWQALTVVLVGLLVGVPFGLIVGRQLWRTFATGLGIVATARVPALPLAMIVAGSVCLALIASMNPGRRAVSATPATALRDG